MKQPEMTLKVLIGDSGEDSRALIGGKDIPGVCQIETITQASGLSKVILTIYAKDCEIVQNRRPPTTSLR